MVRSTCASGAVRSAWGIIACTSVAPTVYVPHWCIRPSLQGMQLPATEKLDNSSAEHEDVAMENEGNKKLSLFNLSCASYFKTISIHSLLKSVGVLQMKVLEVELFSN